MGIASPSPITVLADTATSTSAETIGQKQQALEDQLTQLEGQIDQYQTQITADEQKGTSLTSEIGTLNARIAKLNLRRKLSTLRSNRSKARYQIPLRRSTSPRVTLQVKKRRSGVFCKRSENDQTSIFELFLENPQLSDIWDNAQNISLLKRISART